MDYDKYRAIENWVDADAITDLSEELTALRATKERLLSEVDGVERMILSLNCQRRKLQNTGHYAAQAQFKIDALEEAGLTGHPKADKFFDLAWERGHSDGYHEVMRELDELAELVVQ